MSLNLKNSQQLLMEVIEDTFSKLEETQDGLFNSEQQRLAGNHERVVMPSPPLQEVFAALKFHCPQPLPVGGYRLFAVQKKAIKCALREFIDGHPDLKATEMDALRFDPSPCGHYVYLYQRMKGDKKWMAFMSRLHCR